MSENRLHFRFNRSKANLLPLRRKKINKQSIRRSVFFKNYWQRDDKLGKLKIDICFIYNMK